MSEYQYYEFRAIDRPLDERQKGKLRGVSSRASISSTRMSVFYTFGDFKGDPSELMREYFDAFLYYANWGEIQLAFRFPASTVDADAIRPYFEGEAMSIDKHGSSVVIDLHIGGESREEEPEVDEDGSLSTLLALREDMMRGDYRFLYLAWLLCVASHEIDDIDDDAVEPPVPPGLKSLSPALTEFVKVFDLDRNLIDVAAQASAPISTQAASVAAAAWVHTLPLKEKDDLLTRLLSGDTQAVAELNRRFIRASQAASACPSPSQRTAGALLADAEALAEERDRQASKRAARERAERERLAAEARRTYLDSLATRVPATWKKVDALISTRRPKDYDEAIKLLTDLRDLAMRNGHEPDYLSQLDRLRVRHAAKSSLMTRMEKAKLNAPAVKA